jgi:hypothetical protein
MDEMSLMTGMVIRGREVVRVRGQLMVDWTVVSAVQFRDGMWSIVTSGDRCPDLWPVSKVVAAYVGAADEISEITLVRPDTEVFPYVHVLGVRDGRSFQCHLYFGMWRDHVPEDKLVQR